MPDFIKQREALNETGGQHESVRLELFAVEERLKHLNQELKSLGRVANPDNPALEARKKELQSGIATLEKQAKSQRAQPEQGFFAFYGSPRTVAKAFQQ
jgi:hypothetical protein